MRHALTLLAPTLLAVTALLAVGCQKADSAKTQDPAQKPAAKTSDKTAPDENAAPKVGTDKAPEPKAEVAAKETPAAAKETPKGKTDPAGDKAAQAGEHEGCADKKAGHDEKKGEGCGAPEGSEPPATTLEKTGKGTMHGGAALSGAPAVTVAALMDAPEKWVGKKVTLKGDVSAMCHHKRGWMALSAGDQSGRQLRVITMPAFLVPKDAVSASVTVEGTVEMLELSPKFSKHLANDYGVGKASEKAVKRVIVRATGADFAELSAD